MSVVVKVERSEGAEIVHVAGEVDLASASALETPLDGVGATDSRLVIDLLNVTFIDSSGLNVLVRCRQRIDGDNGNRVRLVVGPGAVRRVFDITGLSQVFSIFESLDIALAA